jgi:replicative DNA helicase
MKNAIEEYTQKRNPNEADNVTPGTPGTHENAAARLTEYVNRFVCMPQTTATGFPTVQEQIKINGLCFIGGDPGTGKTSLLLNIIDQRAKLQLPTLFLSFEMSAPEILQRLAAIETKHPAQTVTTAELKQLNNEVLKYITIIEPGDTLDELGRFDADIIAADVARLRQDHGKNDILLVVDSLNMLETDNANEERRAVNVNIRKLSKFTKINNITTLCVAQSNRDTLKNNAKVYFKDFDENPGGNQPNYNFLPLLYSFRESSLIEYIADSVIYLLRDEADNNDTPTVTRELVNVKNRRRGTNTAVQFNFNRETFTFTERTKEKSNAATAKQSPKDLYKKHNKI